MPRPVSSYITAMKHAMGQTPKSSHNLYATFNDAGRWLMMAASLPPYAHRWNWMTATNAPLTITANLEYVQLPWNFSRLITIVLANSLSYHLVPCTAAQLAQLKSLRAIPTSIVYYSAEAGRIRPSIQGPPIKVLSIYPAQSADRTDISITYERAWEPVPEGDPKTADIMEVDIPDEYMHLLELKCRCLAVKKETDMDSPQLGELGETLAQMVAFDSSRTQDPLNNTSSARASARRWTRSMPPFTDVIRQ
jgi:hypothetical protein